MADRYDLAVIGGGMGGRRSRGGPSASRASESSSRLGAGRAFSYGPRTGEPLPDLDLPTVDGGRLSKRDLAGKPFALATAVGAFALAALGIRSLIRRLA
jgi:hypothetical protein